MFEQAASIENQQAASPSAKTRCCGKNIKEEGEANLEEGSLKSVSNKNKTLPMFENDLFKAEIANYRFQDGSPITSRI